ncbi:zf-HC2 domain-containing protein [Onishia niordana]|uniref:zf-HC2 domain-containing protein n=1 Tax=Onishia niordana TaxID=2508711 RepID=UPI001F0EE101|nr:zf-HC2 domain-containing protein [Halomonas niordiana]
MIKMMMCREVTKLMSKRLDAPLSLKERLVLRVHLSMCHACSECDKQFQLLHQAGQHYQDSPADDHRTT